MTITELIGILGVVKKNEGDLKVLINYVTLDSIVHLSEIEFIIKEKEALHLITTESFKRMCIEHDNQNDN